MSVLNKDAVLRVAASAGIPNVSDEVAAAVAPDVEYRLRELIQDAVKFQRHAKRARLETSDVNSALRMKNAEPLYGYTSAEGLQFAQVPSDPNLFYYDDEEITCSEILNTPLPKIPVEMSMAVHWLAIDGLQPRIPQNPIPRLRDEDGGAGNERDKKSKRKPTAAAGGSSSGIAGTSVGSDSKNGGIRVLDADVRPLVKHVLSREEQTLFGKIVESIVSASSSSGVKLDERVRTAIHDALSRDAGVGQLLPYLAHFFGGKVASSLRELSLLHEIVRAIAGLVTNEHLNISPYLHQLVPTLLTCALARRLGTSPRENHWALRDAAARAVASVCDIFANDHPTLAPRLVRTLVHALLDPVRPLTTHYGAIRCLMELGPDVVNAVLLPNISTYINFLRPILHPESDDSVSDLQRLEAARVFQELVTASGTHLHAFLRDAPLVDGAQGAPVRDMVPEVPRSALSYDDMVDTLGDAVSAFVPSSIVTTTII